MKKYIMSIIALMFISLIAFSPVSASSNEQNAGGIIVGDDNHQDVDNRYYNYDTSNEVEQSNTGTIKGDGNVMIQGNQNNQDTVVDASTNVVVLPPVNNPSVSTLDSGAVQSMVYSTYSGKPFAFDIADSNKADLIQKSGDVYSFGVRSAEPVLVYVVNENELSKALFDKNCAPVQDDYMNKFTFGNLDLAYKGKYRSTSQGFQVTIPKDGKYYLIIDNRVSRSLDGAIVPLTADSIDIAIVGEKTSDGVPAKTPVRTFIGVKDSYPTMANGMANTKV